ncbi:MCE family protein [Dactylosporangium roseum]|uniref:MCE family protein n=1 Tax=Dactylosporangium roseum TaxID=47989 RepID=A0ABY5YZJ6_9ACTN|nr:MCE family protein [Dactylosporangium roseum]UWZ33978.1 MCE family protein [Dactylosporangium roseum]
MRRAALIGLAAVLLAGGCGLPDVASLPLPGGAPAGDGYHVTAEFADVLDLVPQAAVKVDDVTVGSVERISLSGWTARVRMGIDKDVRLPENATAAVRQTSLLGEKYVALEAPTTEAPRGRLTDGAVVPLARTRRSAEVEEVLAALGLLLNGGGLAHLKTINEELAKALAGRETEAKDALRQLDTFVGGLDRQKADIVRAVDSLDRLTGQLSRQRDVIGTALDSLAPGLTVLEAQRDQLTLALTALGELGRVGTRVVDQSRDDTLAVLRSLQPILEQLVKAGDALPKSLDFMLTFPFPPNVTGAIVGDYVNLGATADLDATSILSNLLVATAPPPAAAAAPGGQQHRSDPSTGGKGPGKPPSTGPGLPGVLPLPCLPLGGVLPPGWQPPAGCDLPKECRLLPKGSVVPPGSLLPPGGIVPPGTVFPPGTVLPPGTALSPGCLLPPVTGAVTGQQGLLPDLLDGGLLP